MSQDCEKSEIAHAIALEGLRLELLLQRNIFRLRFTEQYYMQYMYVYSC